MPGDARASKGKMARTRRNRMVMKEVALTDSEHDSNLHPVTARRDIVKRPARILVVDDIETNREIVEAYLTCAGYSVDAVERAAEAIRILESEGRDLVLMDIQMPVMDGIAATRFIRSLSHPIKYVPIIAITANVSPAQVRSYLEAGMNGHVGKPIEPEKLYGTIERCLSEAERDEVYVRPTWLDGPNLRDVASSGAAVR
jgi:CheY-like chemotaxis protein